MRNRDESPHGSYGMDHNKRAQLRAIGERDQLIAEALTAIRGALGELAEMRAELADIKRDLQALEPSDQDEPSE